MRGELLMPKLIALALFCLAAAVFSEPAAAQQKDKSTAGAAASAEGDASMVGTALHPRAATSIVIETWADVDALKAHSAQSHMKAFGASIKDLLANRAVYVLTPT